MQDLDRTALNNILVVLVATSHPGNIGSVARAMKTMGLSRLALVAPKFFPHAEATALAAGADDVLASALVLPTLVEALAGCQYAFGTTARPRYLAAPGLYPRAAASAAVEASKAGAQVALVFGAERTGLTNEELDLCQHTVSIPTDPDFSSLNLAQAVQLLAYELRLAVGVEPAPAAETRELASIGEFEGFMQHLERTLALVDFFKGREYVRLMQRFRRLYQRARADRQEIQLLRGVLAETERAVKFGAKGVAAEPSADSRPTPGEL